LLACATATACALLAACPSGAGQGAGTQAVEVPAKPAQHEPVLSDDQLMPKESEIAPTQAEPGFTYCCGDEAFKLQIVCEEGLMRCYEHREGRWHYTYGRHCKRNLGEACYLHGCDDKC